MISMILIFAALVLLPLLIALPFYIWNSAKDKKEQKAQEIVDRLRGLSGPRVDWSTGL